MDTADHYVGRLHQMGPRSLKATCGIRAHLRCGCWVTLKRDSNDEDVKALERELVEWLAHGLHDDGGEHARKSLELRRSKGMRVK